MEAFISEKEGEEEKEDMIEAMDKRRPILEFSIFPFLSSHASLHMGLNQKKVVVAMYPNLPILASCGDDGTLRIWDIQKHVIVVSKDLGAQATSLSYSPDGSFLAVGLVNGIFVLLESKVDKFNFGTFEERFQEPNLDPVMNPKASKSAVLASKFSTSGLYLAISFDNELGMSQSTFKMSQKSDKFETSSVHLYINKLSEFGSRSQSREPYVFWQKIVLPLEGLQTSA